MFQVIIKLYVKKKIERTHLVIIISSFNLLKMKIT